MKKRLLMMLLLVIPALLSMAEDYQAPALQIQGQNIGIEQVAIGKQMFFNRTNMSFTQVESDMEGWQFVKLNAKSSYLPGPDPVLSVKAASDGYLYAMVADAADAALCATWAIDNGWTKIDGLELAYGTTDAQKLHVYRKACTAGEWVDIVQPATFSRALIMAPSIEEAKDDIKSVAVSIVAKGFAETDVLHNGTKAFGNRTFVYEGVPASLDGWYITRVNGGESPKYTITAKETGDLYVGHWANDTKFNPEAEGWTRHQEYDFHYSDGGKTAFAIYSKAVTAGDVITINTDAWTGVPILSSSEIALSCLPSNYQAAALQIEGTGISISKIAVGNVVFTNRTPRFLSVEDDMNGWNFVSVAANAFNSAAPTTLRALPAENGYVYTLVADGERPELCATWAQENGWEKLEGLAMPYGNNALTILHVYRKACVAGEWMDIVQPSTFSGAMLMAPSIETYVEPASVQSVAISIKAYGKAEVAHLQNGEKIYSNRDFTFKNVPNDLSGMYVTRIDGGASPKYTITAQETGNLYIGIWATDNSFDPVANGWERHAELDFTYTASNAPIYNVYSKAVTEGDVLTIHSTGWGGVPVLSSSEITLYTLPADYQATALQIKGQNIGIEEIAIGKQMFFNRTNMSFTQVESDMEGWKFVKLNAMSGYLPGPDPVLSVKAETDGYLYAMVADGNDPANTANPTICATWASDNGWTKIDGLELAYGAADAQKLHVYRKACTAGEWVDIVQPATFSRALIMAPSIEEEKDDVKSVAVAIATNNYVETDVLHNGTKTLANRTYVYTGVPASLDGMYTTRINGGEPAKFIVTAQETGDLYIGVYEKATDFNAEGWTRHEDYDFHYNDGTSSAFYVYSKSVVEGEELTIATTGWAGIDILSSSEITVSPLPSSVQSVAVSIKAYGKAEVARLQNGELIYSNRTFTFKNVPNDLSGMYVTRIDGGASPKYTITAQETGNLYIGIWATDNSFDPVANGWERHAELDFTYSANNAPIYNVYSKAVTEGDVLTIHSTGWGGVPVLSSSEITLYTLPANYQASALEIKGQNIGIDEIAIGKQMFFNRTNMSFTQVESDMEGWKFVKLNAMSTYLPGPDPVLSVKAETDGYLYAMVADGNDPANTANPTICATWASDNGWTKIDGLELAYGATDAQKLHVYRKACTAGEWVDIVQPATFSRALIMAPSIDIKKYETAEFTVRVKGKAEVTKLNNGELIYSNRTFTFKNVCGEIEGLNVTRIDGGGKPEFTVTVVEDGDILMGIWADDKSYDPVANGWERHAELDFTYTAGNAPIYNVYSKAVKAGDVLVINSTGWGGIPLISSKPITLLPSPQGDVNGDGKVTIADLTELIDILTGEAEATPGADIDGNKQVNKADVDVLRNILLEVK